MSVECTHVIQMIVLSTIFLMSPLTTCRDYELKMQVGNKVQQTNLGTEDIRRSYGDRHTAFGCYCDSIIKRQPSKCDKRHRITPIMHVLCHITQNF